MAKKAPNKIAVKSSSRSAPRKLRAAEVPVEIETEAQLIGEEPVEAAAEPVVTDADAAADDATGEVPVLGLGATDRTSGAETDDGSDSDDNAAAGTLIPFDPLSRYLSDIRRFPLLSREEENVISKRYAKFQDPADAYRLVTANLRLVVKIANEFARATRNLLDLVQEGNVGLMEAVKHFNPEVGIRFPSYAVWWVRAYIYRYLINNWRLVKIGTTQAQRKLFFNLKKESDRLEAEGFTPQPKLLAQRMGVKESEVREMQERMAQSEISLDQPSSPGGDEESSGSLIDAIPDSSSNPEETAARAEWRDFAKTQVEDFARTLEGKDLEIFQERLLADDPPTLQEIGTRYGISRERVRQIESTLKRRFKVFLQGRASDIDRAET